MSDLVVVVSTSAVIDTGQYQRPTTGVGQVRALTVLAPSLVRAYRHIDLDRIRLSSQTPGHELESNLLLLGGPKTNHVTHLVIKVLADALPFQVEETVITWGLTSFEGETGDGKVIRDYGFVVRSANPFSAGRRVVMIAGSHTFGTVAAARWFAAHGGDRRLPADMAVLVQASVTSDGHVTAPRLIRQASLSHTTRP